MRKSVLTLALVCVGVGGCQKPQGGVRPTGEKHDAAPPPELFRVDPAPPVEEDALVQSSSTRGTSSTGDATFTEISSSSIAAPAPARKTARNSAAAAQARTHRVAKGDTLYSLARRYYNNPQRWKELYQANRHQLSGPNQLRVGQTLVIP